MMSDNPYDPPQVETDAVEAHLVCLRCGSALEKGFIHAFGNVFWYPEMTSFKRSVPQRISPKGINLESKITGLKCPQCQTVTVDAPES